MLERLTSSASNTDSVRARARAPPSVVHSPLTSARCTAWLGLSRKAWAVKVPYAVVSGRLPFFPAIHCGCGIG